MARPVYRTCYRRCAAVGQNLCSPTKAADIYRRYHHVARQYEIWAGKCRRSRRYEIRYWRAQYIGSVTGAAPLLVKIPTVIPRAAVVYRCSHHVKRQNEIWAGKCRRLRRYEICYWRAQYIGSVTGAAPLLVKISTLLPRRPIYTGAITVSRASMRSGLVNAAT